VHGRTLPAGDVVALAHGSANHDPDAFAEPSAACSTPHQTSPRSAARLTLCEDMVMARTQTLVQLNDELLAALDQRAAKRGVSRSRVIRDAVESYVHDDLEAEISRRIVEGYRRHPQWEPDEWGDPAAFLDHAARETHRRLNEEERQAGHEAW
jgi:predicted DNA-binding protein